MFTFLLVLSAVIAILMFSLWAISSFLNWSYLIFLLIALVSTLMNYTLSKMEKEITSNKNEIKNIKNQLNLDTEEKIMNSYLEAIKNKKDE